MTKLYALLVIIGLLIFSLPRLALAESVLFSDDFNDGNYNGWEVENGNWTINNGNLVSNQTGQALVGRINHGTQWDNYIVELDVNNQNGIDIGIGFRRDEALHQSYELVLRFGTGAYNTPQIILNREQDNSVVALANLSYIPLNHNQWYKIKIQAENKNIRLWVDNSPVFNILDNDSKVKKGYVSLSTNTGDYGAVFARFDNIIVTDLNPSASPTPTPSPTPSPSPTPPAITPVILIPGIGGSELQTKNAVNWSEDDGHGGTYSHNYPAQDKVWMNILQVADPFNDDYFDILRMKNDGITPEAEFETTGELLSFGYGSTINFLTSNGYVLNESLFIFPYDWRRDLISITPLLESKIEDIESQTNSPKVDIIAHSMGGLLARSYISDSDRAENVRKLLELGVPHLGSVDSLKHIKYGGCLLGDIGQFCLTINPSEMRDVSQNLISFYSLLPANIYFTFYTGISNSYPFPFKDDADIDNNGVKGTLNYSQIKTLLTNLGHNTSLFTPAENLHNFIELDNLNDVDTTIITGSGFPTLGQIIEKKVLTNNGEMVNKKDGLFINGDQRVPLYSSSLDDPNRSISLKGNAKVYYTNQEHGDLVNSGPAMNLAVNILKNSNQIPQNVSNQPKKVDGVIISALSPVKLDLYDSSNNHTGFTENGDFEENIPESFIETLGEAKFIYLPNNGNYLVKLDATNNGVFDLKINKYQNDEIVRTIIYKDIEINSNSKAELNFNTESSNPENLKFDLEGNGSFEKNIPPLANLDSSIKDLESPEIEVIFDPQSKKFKISAIDNLTNTLLLKEEKTSKLFKDAFDNITKINFKDSELLIKDNLNLSSIEYNGFKKNLPENEFEVITISNPKTKDIVISKQEIEIKNGKSVSADYNAVTNKTKIKIKEPKKKDIDLTINGQVLIKLKTNKGNLEISH